MDEEFDQNQLAESENFLVWRSKEESGYIYHIELGGITLHMISDEWEELVSLILSANS